MAASAEKPFMSERSPGRSFDVYETEDHVLINADGTLELSMGPNLARLDFHRVSKIIANAGFAGEPLEVRERIATIVLPTNVFIEFLGVALSGLRVNEGMLKLAMEGQIAAAHDLVARSSGG